MPDETDYLYMGLGALGFILLARYIPQLRTLKSVKSVGCSKCNSGKMSMTIDNLTGIDFDALNIARQKGLM